MVNPSKFRQWRIKQGYTLREVAALTGYSEAMISLVERDKRRLHADDKVKLSRRLGARLDHLFDPEWPPIFEKARALR